MFHFGCHGLAWKSTCSENFLGSWINIDLIKECNRQNWFGFNFTFNKLGNSFDFAQYSGRAWITHAVGG